MTLGARSRDPIQAQVSLDCEEVGVDWFDLKTTVKVEGKTAEQVLKLMEELDDLDDVQKVWANFDMDVADMVSST